MAVRFPPKLPVEAVKTYSIDTPGGTHWREVDCETFGCPTLATGWSTFVDESTPLGRQQAHYIRTKSGRRYTMKFKNSLTVFVFLAGTECFETHREQYRPEIYRVRGGDWRGIVGEIRTHDKPDHWAEDFAHHQDELAKAQR